MNSNDIVAPLVHLNGTGKKGLEEQLSEALNALEAASRALANARPHPRDFYPLGDEAYKKAREQANDRERRIASVMEELDVMVHKVMGLTR